MFVTDSNTVEGQPLNLGGAQGSSIKWLIGPAQSANNFAMRIVTVAPGGRTPEHEHAWEHQWYVLSGEGEAVDAYGQRWPVAPGSAAFVPDGEKHCLVNTGSEPLSIICMIRSTPESVSAAPGAKKGCG
jgi:quercetin dioxygenase-like cupin family protein